MTATRRGSKTARIVFAGIVALAALAALEGLLALAGLPPAAPATATGLSAADTIDERTPIDLAIYEPDPLLLWRLRRSTVILAPDLGFDQMRTNAAGLRGAELPPTVREPSELRVLCLGDSVTAGLSLGERQTYPARLEEALRARLPDRRVRVVNGGVPGHSFAQGRRLFDELRPRQFDVVIAWYGLNDAKPALGAPDAELRMPGVASIQLTAALRRSRIFRSIERIAEPAPGDATRSTPAQTAAAAEHIARAASEDGGTALFVRGPTRLMEKQAQLERVLAAVRAAGADFVEGSQFCLSLYVCAVPPTERIVTTDGEPGSRVAHLAVENEPRTRLSVAQLATRCDAVREWRTRYEAHGAALPARSIDGAGLLGDLAPSAAFGDDVHLTAAGAARVGERLADVVLEAIAKLPAKPR